MKKSLIQLLMLFLLVSCPCYSDEKTDLNPGIFLDPQDVPIFYTDSPLYGMKSFTVITSLSVKNVETKKKVEHTIEKMLETAGKVNHLKDNDMRGFGAGNILLIQLGNVKELDENEIPVSRLSLSIESPITLDKTGTKTFPMVWSINTFLQEPVETVSEKNLNKAVQKILNNFFQSYQYANQDQAHNLEFYTYN